MTAMTRFSAERSGVYGWTRGAASRSGATAAGVEWLEADLDKAGDKRTLLRKIAAAAGYPGDFGDNWDALADVLQDLAWCPADAYVLHLSNAARARRASGDGWRTLLDILSDTAAYWKSRGKAFVVLVDDAPELPQWT